MAEIPRKRKGESIIQPKSPKCARCPQPVEIIASDSTSGISSIIASDSTSGISSRICRSWTKLDEISSLSELKNVITADKGKVLDIDGMRVVLTEGLRRALLFIITDLEHELANKDSDNENCVLMYHGIPRVGKSVLAQTLEYYLGLVYGTTWFMTLCYSANWDNESIVTSLARPCTGAPHPAQNKVFIMDQVNPAVVSSSRFLSRFKIRDFPVIMFTSGYFPPNEDWEVCNTVKISVIHMTVSSPIEGQSLLPKLPADGVEKLMHISTVIGNLERMGDAYHQNISIDQVRQRITVNFSKCDMDLLRVLWSKILLWQDCGSYDKAIQAGMFHMSLDDLRQYQDFMKGNKDHDDEAINGFLNQLVPVLPGEDPKQTLLPFRVFSNFRDVCYYICQDRALYDCFKSQPNNKKDLYNAAVAVFQKATGSLKGHCFELLIQLHCVLNNCGLIPSPNGYFEDFKSVKIFEVSDIEELVHQLVCHEDCESAHPMRFWISLDVEGKKKHPGFDFVCADGYFNHDTNMFELTIMHLIQATVSLQSKTGVQKSIMVREFNYIMMKLISKNFIGRNDVNIKLKCHFCLPYAEVSSPFSVDLSLNNNHENELKQHNATIIYKVQASVNHALPFFRY